MKLTGKATRDEQYAYDGPTEAPAFRTLEEGYYFAVVTAPPELTVVNGKKGRMLRLGVTLHVTDGDEQVNVKDSFLLNYVDEEGNLPEPTGTQSLIWGFGGESFLIATGQYTTEDGVEFELDMDLTVVDGKSPADENWKAVVNGVEGAVLRVKIGTREYGGRTYNTVEKSYQLAPAEREGYHVVEKTSRNAIVYTDAKYANKKPAKKGKLL